jgi:sugar phosphate isomerase/epimerase
MRVANVECFMLTPKTEVEKFRPAIEFGAELGARSATVLLYDADESRVFDNLSRLSELTAAAGLRVGIEFMPFTPKWKNLKETAALVQQLARPNLGICIDMLHLIRSGGTPADVAAIDPAMIAYAQLCDSNDLTANENYFEEAGISRLAPGEGKFPLQEFLQALPAGTPLELEVPRKPDVPARERVRDIVVRTRRQLELAGI